MSRQNWVHGLLLGACIIALTASCTSTGGSDSDRGKEGVVKAGARVEGLEVLWERDFLGGRGVRQIFSDGDLLYVITAKHELNAIGLDGVHRWIATDLTGPVTEDPASNSWAVAFLVGSDLFLYDRAYGNLLLKKRLPFPPSGAPALSEQTLYFGSFVDNAIYTIDLDTGLLGWQFRTKEGVTSAPLTFGRPPKELLCFAGLDGAVTAIDAVDADAIPPDAPAWKHMTNDENLADLARSGNTIFVASTDTKLYALDGVTGEPLWTAPLGSPLDRQPVVGNGRVFGYAGGELVAIAAASGAIEWTYGEGLGDDSFVVPTEGGKVYVYDPARGIVRLDPADGSVLDGFAVDRRAKMVAIPGASLLVAGDKSGMLIAYRL
jgi:outer membrane protein assembly factor BamB